MPSGYIFLSGERELATSMSGFSCHTWLRSPRGRRDDGAVAGNSQISGAVFFWWGGCFCAVGTQGKVKPVSSLGKVWDFGFVVGWSSKGRLVE